MLRKTQRHQCSRTDRPPPFHRLPSTADGGCQSRLTCTQRTLSCSISYHLPQTSEVARGILRRLVSCQRSQSSSTRLLHRLDGHWDTGTFSWQNWWWDRDPSTTLEQTDNHTCSELWASWGRRGIAKSVLQSALEAANGCSQKTQHVHHLRTAMTDASS